MKRQYLLKPDRKDLRDKVFSPRFFACEAHLPKKVDLREMFGPVVDQGELGSCSANMFAALLAYSGLSCCKTSKWEVFSRLFIYYEERVLEGTVNEDAGAMLCDGVKVLENIGACLESEDQYVINNYTAEPTAQMLRDATTYRVRSAHRIMSLISLKAALAENLCVGIGMTVFESMESADAAQTGIVPMPKEGDDVLGGHAVLVVGYDDDLECMIVRNSWGNEWGDKGYFYLPYKFWSAGYISDAWTILV